MDSYGVFMWGDYAVSLPGLVVFCFILAAEAVFVSRLSLPKEGRFIVIAILMIINLSLSLALNLSPITRW